jgi:hypothetical protein
MNSSKYPADFLDFNCIHAPVFGKTIMMSGQLELDTSKVGLRLPPTTFFENESEPDTEEDDPDISRRVGDSRFLTEVADTAWRTAGAEGIVGLQGLTLEQRGMRERKRGTPRRITAAGSISDDEDVYEIKWFYTVVAEVDRGSDAFYAGNPADDTISAHVISR